MTASRQLGWVVGLSLAVGGNLHAEVEFPAGTQNFEAMNIGDDVNTLTNWILVNSSGLNFVVEAANDVLGNMTPRGASTKWLRITDLDDVEPTNNRFYTPTIQADPYSTYRWTFHINLENTPPSTGSKPRFTIQHLDTVLSFANAWGIEFTASGANLIVTGIGGTAASTPLYSLASPTGIGDWVRLDLHVNFANNTVSASVNGGAFASLPINLAGTANRNIFRFCYRGEGAGNKVTMLLDDVSVAVIPPVPTVSEWGLVVLGLSLLAAGQIACMRRMALVG